MVMSGPSRQAFHAVPRILFPSSIGLKKIKPHNITEESASNASEFNETEYAHLSDLKYTSNVCEKDFKLKFAQSGSKSCSQILSVGADHLSPQAKELFAYIDSIPGLVRDVLSFKREEIDDRSREGKISHKQDMTEEQQIFQSGDEMELIGGCDGSELNHVSRERLHSGEKELFIPDLDADDSYTSDLREDNISSRRQSVERALIDYLLNTRININVRQVYNLA
ncbi:unnamed protein product [Protopolystoma xenopodis]|uniref:Uncharacterized protein n=1 Tax=Protopolystoma xenopodis TaxID=117903 RepID=A0A3S5CRJ9_9PLAT|nr:unnamed protein product [Protopolystoma xenopodis]